MFRNYLKIAVRNLLRSKGFSIINISGLAIGMGSALLILLWVQNEISYDRFYSKTDRLYKMYNRDRFGGGEMVAWENTPKVMAATLKKDYPEVENVTRFNNITFLVTTGETHLNSRGAFADSSFLEMFDFPLLRGDASQALKGGYDIVLTQKMATSLFGKEDPMGKIVRIDSNANFTVTGVLKDLPSNTSFDFDYLLPWSFMTHLGWDDQTWNTNSIYTYVLLKPGASQAAFDAKVKNITINHSPPQETTQVFTQPMSRYHLYSRSENGQLVGSRVKMVRLFVIIAVFILLIACINFMNLSTARSEKRAKEVGIRKVVGAYRGYLVAQFIGESILIAILAFILALLLVQISLGGFNLLVGKELHVAYGNPVYWLFALGFILFTGLLAGSYPAFYLSAFKPAKVLKGAFKRTNALVKPRKILVVLQFSFAIVLMIGTFIIWRQIRYGQDRDAGYNRNNLVYTFTQGDVTKYYNLIRQDLVSSGAAVAVTKTAAPITQHWGDSNGYTWDGSTEKDKKTDFINMGCDADFVKTMGVALLQGRDIDVYKYPTDSTAMLLNESAVNAMHLTNPVGANVRRDDGRSWHVVGVIKDFILESPFERKIAPMVISGPNYFFQVIHFKLNPANTAAVDIAKAAAIFRKYNPQYPFEYIFVDESYARKFREDQRVGKLAALFAGLTIFISCLGLFALASYMAENRVKEIGVRKVLGASISGITTLLAKDFIKLVLVAFLIASPIAWFLMDKWLQGYDYHIEVGWQVFALTGLLAMFIAVLTVSYQSIRAAIANPVKSLRSE
jgi:ABC-type antimicrobial peptide transport system permease subunit